jgi:hypothetical protein
MRKSTQNARPAGSRKRGSRFREWIVRAACINALCVVVVTSGCSKKQWRFSPPAPPAPGKDFNTNWDPKNVDPNGAPRNPDWAPQLQGNIPDPNKCDGGNPYNSPCTDDKPFLDPPNAFADGFCYIGKVFSGSPMGFFGHADWMVAQYDGNIGWMNFGDDSDYDLVLVPGNVSSGTGIGHGITANNNQLSGRSGSPRYIELEFASEETDLVFTTGFWGQFKTLGEAYDSLDPQPQGDQLADLLHPGQGSTLACGSTVGLFGLDCDHGCRSEVHPVYALAIQRKEDRDDNEWAVLVRNWGTGGFCSSYNQELAETSLSLALPYSSAQPPTSVEVDDFVPAGGVSCPKAYFQDGQLLLNFTLPAPQSGDVASMTVKVRWPEGAQASACAHVSTSELRMAMAAETSHKPAALSGEEYSGALLRGAFPGRRLQDLNEDIVKPYQQTPRNQTRLQKVRRAMAVAPTSCAVIPVVAGRPPLPTKVAAHRLSKDTAKQVREEALLSTVCKKFRDTSVPPPVGTRADLDRACKNVK